MTTADGLLSQLVVPGAPGVLVSYLSYALDNGLLDARAFVVALLVRMYRAAQAGGAPLLPTSLLSSIATALLSASPGLGILPLPSPVPLPTDAPDVGTSAAAAAAGTEDVALLSLLMPLLRLWAVAPVPPPVVALAARLTALVPPLPVPPFELGLEGAQLTAVLPEDISKPLRECLAGLMADLPMPMPAPLFPTPRDAPFDANAAALASAPAPSPCVSALPLRQATSLLLEHALRAHRWSRNSGYARSPTLPPAPFRHLIRLGRALTADPHEFFVALLDAAVARIHASFAPGRLGTSSAVRAAAFLTHELPTLLRWWRDTADTKWPYPANNLRGALGGMFAEHAPAMQAYFQELTTLYAAKSAQGEPDDEAGPFVQPDGWALAPFEGLAVQRYVELGLLDEESTVVLTGSPVKPVPPGESLLERFVSAPPAHLPALEVIITYAAGAPQAFGAEVVKVCR